MKTLVLSVSTLLMMGGLAHGATDFPPTIRVHASISAEKIASYNEVAIIGDIHGCFDELKDLLNKMANPNSSSASNSTLFILAGDTVNKGPKNIEVLNFLTGPDGANFMAVRGNHEEKVLKSIFKKEKKDIKWARQMSASQREWMQNLPYTLTLEGLNATVVHAGLTSNQLDRNDFHYMVNMRTLNKGKPSDDEKGTPWAPLWKGPTHVYFGHNAKLGLQKTQFATGLDTGCVKGKKMTGVFVTGPRKGTFVSTDCPINYEKTLNK